MKASVYAIPGMRRTITPNDIDAEVCYSYNIAIDQLRLRTRKREISEARQVAMYLYLTQLKLKQQAVALHFGDFNRATVLYSRDTVINLKETNKTYNQRLQTIIHKLKFSGTVGSV